MAKNDGKAFEKLIREQFKAIRNVSVDRINDNVGYAGAYNIADLIVYRKPYKYYIECKTVSGRLFQFTKINLKALEDMERETVKDGVRAYFIIWFKDLDKTIAISANEIYSKIYGEGKKSIGVKSFDDFDFIELDGIKRRKFYNYDLEKLLNDIDRDLEWRS